MDRKSCNNSSEDDPSNNEQSISMFRNSSAMMSDVMPNEVLEYIVGKLPLDAVIAISQACRKLYLICSRESIWKEIVAQVWDLKRYPLSWLPPKKGWKFMAQCLVGSVPSSISIQKLDVVQRDVKSGDKFFTRQEFGIIQYSDCRIYEGEVGKGTGFQNGKIVPNGKGLLVARGMYTYEGEFKNGLRDGEGKIQYLNGISYTGGWKESKQHGIGKKIWPSGDSYCGEFRNDKANGKGYMKWASGQEYEGEFINDKANGTGIMLWPNGLKFKGEFKMDKPNGVGVVTTLDGQSFVSRFRDGVIVEMNLVESVKKDLFFVGSKLATRV